MLQCCAAVLFQQICVKEKNTEPSFCHFSSNKKDKMTADKADYIKQMKKKFLLLQVDAKVS